jgi:hypothetical protein
MLADRRAVVLRGFGRALGKKMGFDDDILGKKMRGLA